MTRCAAQEPVKLDHKDNPEHGLRLILTFEPSTSFLVPLDRCIILANASISRGGNGAKPLTSMNPQQTHAAGVVEHKAYYREQVPSQLSTLPSSSNHVHFFTSLCKHVHFYWYPKSINPEDLCLTKMSIM